MRVVKVPPWKFGALWPLDVEQLGLLCSRLHDSVLRCWRVYPLVVDLHQRRSNLGLVERTRPLGTALVSRCKIPASDNAARVCMPPFVPTSFFSALRGRF